MNPQRPEDALITLLRSAYRNTRHGARTTIPKPPAPRYLSFLVARNTIPNQSIAQQEIRSRTEKLSQARRQPFSTVGVRYDKVREIAVLGGGITGLTTAHYLARHAENTHITLYEGSDRLGGWVDGKLRRVGDGEFDKVLFQRGPRMLRSGRMSLKYDDLIFYDVLVNLNLQNKLVPLPGLSKNRYLYYPDHLVSLPVPSLAPDNVVKTIRSFLTEPLWDGAVSAAWKTLLSALPSSPWAIKRAAETIRESMAMDESVGEFFEKFWGDDRVVKNILSGMMHGIYGGDVYKLSIRHTVFDGFWRKQVLPRLPGASWSENKDILLVLDMRSSPNTKAVSELAWKATNFNVMGFDDGLLGLLNGLVKDLQQQKNVTIKTGSRVNSLASKGGRVTVTTENRPRNAKQYDHVISTLFSKHLAEIVQPQGSLPSLAKTHAVTIMVVNLWFPNPDLLADNHGFGYLVPTSTPNNDDCILGVLFDSDLDTYDKRRGTKLTVMMGGHHWDGWTSYPTEEMAQEMALQAVRRHLRIDPNERVFASAKLCRDCLPQHYVGHRQRMRDAHHELQAAFHGRLSVAGPSYTAVGVIPAMRAGYDIAMRTARGRGPPWFRNTPDDNDALANNRDQFADYIGDTGLEGFALDEFAMVKPVLKVTMPFRLWSNPPKNGSES
ncbi:Protoporphyrinogen oxidase [Hypomontagnella monticulosa]|nr:Protoporphyrinogen oxidase [Hypomontagnella monticulosa]